MSETTMQGPGESLAPRDTLLHELKQHARSLSGGVFADVPMHRAEVTALGEGHHNINALVTVDDFQCVARTRPNQMGEPCNPITAEYEKLRALGGQFCPAPLHLGDIPCRVTGGTAPVLYMEHVPGETQDLSVLPTKQTRRIAQRLSDLHSTPIEPLRALGLEMPANFDEYIRRELQTAVFDRLAQIDLHDPLYVQPLKYIETTCTLLQEELEKQRAAFTRSACSPLHRDLSKGNILWLPDDDCQLIDWESLCLGDPADDISYFLTDNQVQPKSWQEFLQHYKPPAGDDTFYRRLKAYDLKNWADDMTWALAGYDRERKGVEVVCADRPGIFKEYYEDRLTRLGAFLHNLRYNEE